jgi:GBP family porin
MKKSLIALAVLSTIAGSVAAQSSVTIYGRINPGVSDTKVTRGDDKVTNTQGYAANSWTTSRLGVDIVEDLGSGMKAVGTWESAIVTEGANGVTTVRQAFAGLKGGFGTVTIGNQYTTEYYQRLTQAGTTNSIGFGGVSGLAVAQTTGTAVHGLGEITQGNSIRWVSPAMGAFTFAADFGKVSQDNNVKTAAASSASTETQTDFLGLSVSYAAGPVTAGLSYSEQKQKAAAYGTDAAAVYNVGTIAKGGTTIAYGAAASTCTPVAWVSTVTDGKVCELVSAATTATAAVDTKQKNLTANATYQLTPEAKLFAFYADRETKGTTNLDYKTYNVGAQYAIGKFTPFAQYSAGDMKDGATGAKLNDLSSTQFGVTYALSKRTTGYAYVAEYKNKLAGATDTRKSELTTVGIAHNF